jgi:hypothetical protein
MFYIQGGGFCLVTETARVIAENALHKHGVDCAMYVATYATVNASDRNSVSVAEILDQVHTQYVRCCRDNPDAKIVIAGDSAGGRIATALLLKITSPGYRNDLDGGRTRAPVGTLLLSPWLDVEMTSELASAEENRRRDFMVRNFVEQFSYNIELAGGVDTFTNLLRCVRARSLEGSLGKVFIVAGGGEIMADESRALYVAADSHDVELYVGNRAPHIFVMSPLFTPEGLDGYDEAWREMTHRLKDWFGDEDVGERQKCLWCESEEDDDRFKSARKYVERAVDGVKEGRIRKFSF